MPWWKIALPVLAAGSGVTAAVVATVRSGDAGAVPVSVWFDAPADLATFAAGPVVVQAHTAADVGALTLTVDGQPVATDDQLALTGDLRHAELTWDATAGTHELQVSAGAARSDTRVVFVDGSSTATTAPPTTTTPTSTSVAATTTSSSTTTSTTEPGTTVPAAATTTQAPVTTAPATTLPKPVIGTVTGSVDGSCNLVVAAAVSGADSASVQLKYGTVISQRKPFDLDTTPAQATLLVLVDFTPPGQGTVASTLTVTAKGPGGTSTKVTPYTLPSCKI